MASLHSEFRRAERTARFVARESRSRRVGDADDFAMGIGIILAIVLPLSLIFLHISATLEISFFSVWWGFLKLVGYVIGFVAVIWGIAALWRVVTDWLDALLNETRQERMERRKASREYRKEQRASRKANRKKTREIRKWMRENPELLAMQTEKESLLTRLECARRDYRFYYSKMHIDRNWCELKAARLLECVTSIESRLEQLQRQGVS